MALPRPDLPDSYRNGTGSPFGQGLFRVRGEGLNAGGRPGGGNGGVSISFGTRSSNVEPEVMGLGDFLTMGSAVGGRAPRTAPGTSPLPALFSAMMGIPRGGGGGQFGDYALNQQGGFLLHSSDAR